MTKQQRPEVENTSTLWDVYSFSVAAWALILSVYFSRNIFAGFRESFHAWTLVQPAILPHANALAGHAERIFIVSGFSTILCLTGRLFLRVADVHPSNLLEEAAISFAFGYGCWGTALFFIGLAGLWTKGILSAMTVLGAILAIIEWFLRRKRGIRVGFSSLTSIDKIVGAVAALVALSSLRYCLIPETFYDALQYHLGLPNLYLNAGRIFPTPENSYSGIPALPQMISAWTLAFDSWGITAAVFHWSLIGWAMIGIIAMARRLGRPQAGIFSAAVFALTPVVIGESFRTSVGLEWTIFEICAFSSLMAALGENPAGPRRRGWLVLSGSFVGLAMCTKYPAWLLPLAVLPAIFIGRRDPANPHFERLTARELSLVFLVASAWLAPWVIKNFVFYRNPIYPFFHEHFSSRAEYVPNWRGISGAGGDLRSFLSARNLLWRLFPSKLLLPVDGPDQSIGLFALCFMPLLARARLKDEERFLAWVCLLAWAPLVLLSPITRFLIPHLALVTLLVSCVIAGLASSLQRTIFLVLGAAVSCIVGLAWAVLVASPDKLAVFLGEGSYSDYLGHSQVSYATPPYVGIEFLNQHAPGQRVMLYGESRGFFLRSALLATSDDQIPAIETWIGHGMNVNDLRKKLADEKIEYILFNGGEIGRRHLTPAVNEEGRRTLREFWNRYTEKVFETATPLDRWISIYKIRYDSDGVSSVVDPTFEAYLDRVVQPH